MECDNQGTASVHMLKSGETVFLYYDHSTGEQEKCLERNDSLVTSISTQGSLQSAATRDEPSTMHSIGTQTDHDVLQGSTVAMTTRNSGTEGRDTTNIKSYDSTSTETDLNAIGDRKTLESLLRWALAICTSEGDVAHQDAQELQYSKRNTDPLPIFSQACQWEKTASDSQHSIGLERAQYGNSTKGNDPASDVLGETFREDSHHDGDLLSRLHLSTLCSSDDMHAEEVEHRVSNELQSTVTISDNLQVNSPSHLDQTLYRQQESSIGNAIYDNLQVNSPHLDQTPGKQQESGIEMAISEHLQAPEERPHACTICKRRFTRSYSLTIHMRVHSQEKPYACTICKKRCTTSGNLTSHMRLHSQEKPYACTICKKRFSQSCNLTTHMRIHTGERPYLCQVCGKRFTQLSNLKHHSIVHSREYPYECSECGKGFPSPSHRDKHLYNHKCAKPP